MTPCCATERYTALAGRAATVAMVSMLAASALAAPAYALGGFGLIAAGSVLACLGSAAAAVPSLSALDEYGPLLVRDLGVATAGVPWSSRR
ncbi:hypothetical protein ACFQZ4_00905 [Catellatospora coxensis]